MNVGTNMDDKKIDSLPREYISWLISTEEDCEVEDSDGEEMIEQRMVLITDSRGVVIAVDMKSPEKLDTEDHIRQALEDAMTRPMAGKPRRPTHVVFKTGPCLPETVLLWYGISSVKEQADCGCNWINNAMELRACSRCRRRGDSNLFTLCSGCDTVLYCSKDCQEKDLFHPMDMHGHHDWCAKMKSYLKNGIQLAKLPFSFILETTCETFGRHQYRDFLKRHNILGKGLWQRELELKCPKHMPQFGELQIDASPYGLSKGTTELSTPPSQDLVQPLTCWTDYYAWRGLSLDSPIAVLLSMPLTLYHIILQLPQHYNDRNISTLTSLSIHIIGAEKEVDMIPVFEELGLLLPNIEFHLLFIGPEISKKISGKVIQMRNITVNIQKGLYHHLETNSPDIVVGFNAGLGAYGTWGNTLQELKKQKTPAFFTDYCHYSCECAKGPVEGLQIGEISDIQINPFRSPVRRYCDEHKMPWYSNAFLFSLQYS